MANLGVRFILELCTLAALGYWGVRTGTGWTVKIIMDIDKSDSIICIEMMKRWESIGICRSGWDRLGSEVNGRER